MKFVATKTADQPDLQDCIAYVSGWSASEPASSLFSRFLLERGIVVRQGQRFLRAESPRVLAMSPDVLSPRMARVIEDLAGDCAASMSGSGGLSSEIEAIAGQDAGCDGDERARDRANHLQRNGGRDWRWRSFTKAVTSPPAGLVPRHMLTAIARSWGRISKRGNRDLRASVRAGGMVCADQTEELGVSWAHLWIEVAKAAHDNVLAIALANKLARIAWSVLARGRTFEVSKIEAAAARPA